MSQEIKFFTILLISVLTAAHAGESARESGTTGDSEKTERGKISGDNALALSLDDALERVESVSPAVLLQRERVRQVLERSYQQRAALLPQISAHAEQRRQQLGRGFAGGGLEAPPFNAFTSRVEGRLAIVDTDSYANYRIAELEHAVSRMEYEEALESIKEQTIFLYLTHLRDLRKVGIIEGNIERERELLELARDQLEAGAAVEIDVTRAQVRLARERRRLLQARTEVENSLLELKALLDIEAEREVIAEESLLRSGDQPQPFAQEEPVKAALGRRPELRSSEKGLEQARLSRKAAGWQRLPQVELFGEWGYDSDEPLDGQEGEAWLVGLRASIPIFEGFRIGAEKREADAAIREKEYALRDLENEIEREIRFARVEMKSRFEQIAIARDEVRLGRAEVGQARERYDAGLGDNRELIDAQQRLADAEDSRLDATYLYGLSRLSYARAAGDVERIFD
ncbi:MAG: TolC family protein [Opitutales bacterium]